jgi:hypothetical protein
MDANGNWFARSVAVEDHGGVMKLVAHVALAFDDEADAVKNALAQAEAYINKPIVNP